MAFRVVAVQSPGLIALGVELGVVWIWRGGCVGS